MSDAQPPSRPTWWTPPDGTAPDARPAEAMPPPTQPVPPTQPAPGWPPPAYPPNQPYVAYGYGYGWAPARNNGLAVASLVCGIVSVLGGFFCFIGALAAVPGLVLGISGLGRIKRSNGTEKGRGLAIAGIATSAVGILVLVLLVILLGFSLVQPPS